MAKSLSRTVQAAALASLLGAPEVVRRVHADPAIPDAAEFIAFIDKLWQEAWGSPFLPGQSGLLLQERGPGVFDVGVSDGQQTVAQGIYYELLRLEQRHPGGEPDGAGGAGLQGIEDAVTAGLLLGSTGSISAVFGLDSIITFEGDSGPQVIEGFVPLGLAGDADGAEQGAYDLHARLDGTAPVLAGDEPPLERDPCRCIEMYGDRRSACRLSDPTCLDNCWQVRRLAIVSCFHDLATFPLFCMLAANTAYGECVDGCLAATEACLREAADEFIDCLLDCLSPRFFNRWRS